MKTKKKDENVTRSGKTKGRGVNKATRSVTANGRKHNVWASCQLKLMRDKLLKLEKIRDLLNSQKKKKLPKLEKLRNDFTQSEGIRLADEIKNLHRELNKQDPMSKMESIPKTNFKISKKRTKDVIEMNSKHLRNKNAEVPVNKGIGNCFFTSVAISVYKNENVDALIRLISILGIPEKNLMKNLKRIMNISKLGQKAQKRRKKIIGGFADERTLEITAKKMNLKIYNIYDMKKVPKGIRMPKEIITFKNRKEPKKVYLYWELSDVKKKLFHISPIIIY
jgi:hypothetical protein